MWGTCLAHAHEPWGGHTSMSGTPFFTPPHCWHPFASLRCTKVRRNCWMSSWLLLSGVSFMLLLCDGRRISFIQGDAFLCLNLKPLGLSLWWTKYVAVPTPCTREVFLPVFPTAALLWEVSLHSSQAGCCCVPEDAKQLHTGCREHLHPSSCQTSTRTCVRCRWLLKLFLRLLVI